MSKLPPSERERFLGCLLGLAIGDALGAPFEGMPAEAIWYQFGGADKIVEHPPVDMLCYADDTQMCIAVAETLIEKGEIDEQTLCDAFVRRYDPLRGYGQGARRILEMMGRGGNWKSLSHSVFPGGSLGNGAAMRVAPVGLMFHDDLDRVFEQARLSALPTHVHPIGVEGAQMLALAVALVMREGKFNSERFYGELTARAATDEFRYQLGIAAQLAPTDAIQILGNSLRAHRSVATAIACFALTPDSYATAIGSGIGVGNDTDTIAAMAGAISGAYLGSSAIPRHLLDRLEDGPQGRTYIEKLADQLCSQSAARRGISG